MHTQLQDMLQTMLASEMSADAANPTNPQDIDNKASILAFQMAEIKAVTMFEMLVKAHENKGYFSWTHYFFMYKWDPFSAHFLSYLIPYYPLSPFKVLYDNGEFNCAMGSAAQINGDTELVRKMLILWDLYEPQLKSFRPACTAKDKPGHCGHLDQQEVTIYILLCKLGLLVMIVVVAFQLKALLSEFESDLTAISKLAKLVETWLALQFVLTFLEFKVDYSRGYLLLLGMERVSIAQCIRNVSVTTVELARDIIAYAGIIKASDEWGWEATKGLAFAGLIIKIMGLLLNLAALPQYFAVLCFGKKSDIWYKPCEADIQKLCQIHGENMTKWKASWPRLEFYELTAKECMRSLLSITKERQGVKTFCSGWCLHQVFWGLVPTCVQEHSSAPPRNDIFLHFKNENAQADLVAVSGGPPKQPQQPAGQTVQHIYAV
jgi:hypothetical protein